MNDSPSSNAAGRSSHAQDHGTVLIALHWITVVLVIAAFILGPEGGESSVYSAAMDAQRNRHEFLGVLILVLTFIRLGWRVTREPAEEDPSLPDWMARAALAMRIVLYILLVVTPFTAIFGAWMTGHALTLGPLGEVRPLIAENRAVGEVLAGVHGWLGNAVVWLGGAHAAAALYHHFVLKDAVLLGMLPGWMRRRS